MDQLRKPAPGTDGLLPFTLKRLKLARPRIEALGQTGIPFLGFARPPLNLATFLLGTTEFMLALKTDRGQVHKLLRLITNFLKNEWRDGRLFPSIGGSYCDIVGFSGHQKFQEFGLPYLKDLYTTERAVKFFHNDAQCEQSGVVSPRLG